MSVNDSFLLCSKRILTQKMGFTRNLQICGLLLAAVIVLTYAQPKSFTFPPRPKGGFPFRPSPNRPSSNPNRSPGLQNPFAAPSVRTFLHTYCPLTFKAPFTDPNILEATPSQLAQARESGRRVLNTSQRLYLDGKRLQTQARDRRRSQDQARGGPATAPGRTKRQEQSVNIALLAPTEKKSVCRSVEKVVQSVYSEDEVCYLFDEEEVLYWECGTKYASFPNTDIKMQRYYCESDNYVYQSVMAYCPTSNDIRWVTIYVPISCCARRYSCNFTPYSSIDGAKRFQA